MSELNEDTYRRLKQEVESTRADAERAKGALEQLMSQLKRDFECATIKEAKSLLEALEVKRQKAAEKFAKALADYERKWKHE